MSLNQRLVFWGIVAFILLLLTSCKSVQYVPVESVRIDSIYRTFVQRDSILVKDSIFVREKGDTVYEMRYKYIYRDRVKSDTLYIEKRDSVPVPYPVEKSLTWWQKIKLGYAELIIAVVLVLAGIVIWRVQKK